MRLPSRWATLNTFGPDRWDWATAALLTVVFAVVFQLGVPLRASFGARVTADEPFYLLTTESLRADGDLDLTNQYERMSYARFWDASEPLWHQSSPGPGGALLSPHNLGLPVLLLPAYALGGLEAAKGFLGIVGGLTVGSAYLLARRVTAEKGAAGLAAVLLGASAPWFVYSTQVYPEMPAALLVCLVMWMLLRPRLELRHGIVISVLLTAAMWLGTKYAPLGALLFLLTLARSSRLGALVLGSVTAALAGHYLWFHVVTFGGLTPYAVNRLYAGHDTFQVMQLHWGFADRLYRLLGLWLDREFGVARWAPILLLSLPGCCLLLRRRAPAVALLLAALSVQVLVATFLAVTMRGWWFPGRMLVVALPLIAPLLAIALEEARNRRGAIAAGALVLAAGTLSATASLWSSARTGEIALAVNPFAAGGWWLDTTAPLFPLFTAYGPDTVALSALWLGLGAGIVAWVARGYPASRRACQRADAEAAA